MECSHARFLITADPGSPAVELADHLLACEPCTGYQLEILRLDARLRLAMAVPVPSVEGPIEHCATAARRARSRFLQPLAMAASAAAAAVLLGLLWVGLPSPSLARAVVAHMSVEPAAWTSTSVLSPAEVSAVLAAAGLRLDAGLTDVTYAHSCWFRGHYVPHLVVRTADGPVTVLALPHEEVRERTEFAEGGYRGVLVPAARGSLAVLAREHGDVEAVVASAMATMSEVH